MTLARLTEQVGLDLVTVQDHPYQARFLDTWTLLSVRRGAHLDASGRAQRGQPAAAPAGRARSQRGHAWTCSRGGRVELGLGAGAFWDAIEAIGGPRLTPGAAVDALEEAIQVIRAVWDVDGGTVRVDGEYYRVRAPRGPGAGARGRASGWARTSRGCSRLTGRLADGWLPSRATRRPATWPTRTRRSTRRRSAAGRAPRDGPPALNVSGQFGTGTGFLARPAEEWAEQLAELALTEGVSAFILGTDDPDDAAPVRRGGGARGARAGRGRAVSSRSGPADRAAVRTSREAEPASEPALQPSLRRSAASSGQTATQPVQTLRRNLA